MLFGLLKPGATKHLFFGITKANMTTTAAASSAARQVFIGSDHGGFEMKEALKNYLKSKEVPVNDVGTHSADSCDYPDIAQGLCTQLLGSPSPGDLGILVCGTGIGISMAANKVAGIRCALCHDHFTAKMCRQHNNANVLALGGRTTGIEVAKEIVDTFLTEGFQGGRHERRVGKIE
jgi:ribose 5-phosphate isomerase B